MLTIVYTRHLHALPIAATRDPLMLIARRGTSRRNLRCIAGLTPSQTPTIALATFSGLKKRELGHDH